MKLKTINRFLRAIGLVLVVTVWDHEGPFEATRLHIDRWKCYQKRTS